MRILRNIIILSLFVLTGVYSVNAIDVVKNNSKTTHCPWANVSRVYYIPNNQNTYNRWVIDEFWMPNDVYIWTTSRVWIWTSDNSLLKWCTSSSDWGRYSEIAPWNNTKVVALWANCIYNKPTNKNKRTIQFVFNIKYADITKNWTKTDTESYMTYDGSFKTHKKTYKNFRVWRPIKTHENECMNIELRYCGDGIVSNWEKCDPQAPGYNEQNCSVQTCTPIEQPEPVIEVDKRDANPNDLDSNYDVQTIKKWDNAVFKITVTNKWTEDLKNVYLVDELAPECSRTKSQVKSIMGKDILKKWESFNYKCTVSNPEKLKKVWGKYVNIIKVYWTGVTSNKNVQDDDDTDVIIKIYDLALRKVLPNSSNEYKPWDNVSFDIQVYNQWNTPARKITIVDYIPNWLEYVWKIGHIWAGSDLRVDGDKIFIDYEWNILEDWNSILVYTLDFKIKSDATWTITNWAEIASDDWDDCDSIPDTDVENDKVTWVVDNDIWDWCNPGWDEDDHDPESIVIKETPVCTWLTVNPNSWSVPLTSNFICSWDWATSYKIEVKNSSWTILEPIINSNTGSYNFTEKWTYNVACYINNRNTTEEVCKKQVNVWVFDLALRKTVETAGPYKVWDVVKYKIEVINQWDVAWTNIEVTDYIPENMQLVDWDGWQWSGRKVKKVIPTIATWETKVLYIRLKILDWATWTIINWSEISEDHATDCDSTADDINHNTPWEKDAKVVDDNVGSKCDGWNWDEDDHDPASITITEDSTPACEAWVTWNQSSPISENTPNLCSNNGETPVDFSSSTNWNTTTYTWSCKDTNNVVHTGGNCNASYTTSHWWGRWAVCYDIETSGNTVTCLWNDKTATFKIDCWNGTYKVVPAVDTNDGSLMKKATSTCDYSTAPKVSEPRCYVSQLGYNVIPSPKENYSGFTTRNQCQATVWQTCWNGILEGNEECEKDSSGNWPSVCNTNCTLKTSPHWWGWVTTDPGQIPWVITIPYHWKIVFGEKANVIIYKWQSVAEKVSTPYIKNDSDYDLSFKSLCVVQTSWNTLTTPSIQSNCKALPSILYPGQKVEFPWAYNQYKGKQITSGDYGDNVLKITYQNHRWQILDWAYFAETVKVRVAKPSVVTTGWGTSYLKNINKVSDINKVSRWVVDTNKEDDNKNFVWTSVSDLTSYSDNTTDTTVVDEVENTWNNYDTSLNWVISNTSWVATNPPIALVLSSSTWKPQNWIWENYNWMKNVYLIKGKNIKISNSNLLSWLTWPRTYIIENGTLYINKDIVYNDNIAFVVKWGDIVIDSNVKRIDGTYITLKKWHIWWKIKSAQSTETLVVNGSLYGNIDDLVSNRVKVEENNWNLSVWTIVSFGSSLFRKPAPLVSQFIAEYVEQQKVAQ